MHCTSPQPRRVLVRRRTTAWLLTGEHVMDVLVTGGCGFIGRAVSAALRAGGHSVVSVHRTAPHGPECVRVADLSDPGLDTYLQPGSVVVHLASSALPRDPIAGNRAMERELVDTKGFLHRAARAGSRIVLVSSGGTVYGHVGTRVPVSELQAAAPTSAYGRMKLELERILETVHDEVSASTMCLRISNAYGPGQYPRERFGVIPTFLSQIRAGRPCEVWNPLAVRDYVYVDDVADALVRAAVSPVSGEVVNIGTSIGTSNSELVEMISDVLGEPLRTVEHDAPSGDVDWIVLDVTRAAELLGWIPTIELRRGLSRTARWFSECVEPVAKIEFR
jgi:UDP-glucose 4-epimerase